MIEYNEKTKREKTVKIKKYLAVFLIIIFSTVINAGCMGINGFFDGTEDINGKVENVDGEISFHFLMLGNKYSGDCIFIKAGENDILIDAGSRENSSQTIKTYVNDYCTDNVLEYVIATHADRDHIACFGCEDGIFDSFKCKTIIDFPKTDSETKTYGEYIKKRDNEVKNDGASHYTALQCYNNEDGAKRIYNLTDSVTMEILYNYYYENKSSDENNYSVCLMFKHGNRQFLFTGDLEKEGEEKLVQKYPSIGQVELFKAGHHGSKTSSNICLLEKIYPKICVCSCNAGYGEFTDEKKNMFPTQDFINRISKYTDKVYITTLADVDYTDGEDYLPFNGNIVVISDTEKVSVNCSYSNDILKDTAWFKKERICPSTWI